MPACSRASHGLCVIARLSHERTALHWCAAGGLPVLSLMLLPIVLGRVLLPRLLFPAAREGEVAECAPTHSLTCPGAYPLTHLPLRVRSVAAG